MHKLKIISFLLLLSLGGNIALASWMFGRAAAGHVPASPSRIELFREMADSLPPGAREAVIDAARTHRQELRASMEDVAAARRDLRELLAQDDVDMAALAQGFATLREKTALAQQQGHEMMLEIMPHVPPENRRQFLEKKGHILK